jgi:HK97 family phage prohead protease
MTFTKEQAELIASMLKIDFASAAFELDDFHAGINVELEHGKVNPETNVTDDDPILTGKIAWYHLLETPLYYKPDIGLESWEAELIAKKPGIEADDDDKSKKSAAVTREHKSFKFELESADEDGEFSGYAAVFGNRDSGDDIIEKGAFAKTIKEDFDRIKILSQHDDCELPIGKPLELREDEKGLFIKGKISDTHKGRDIRTLLKDGVLNELSIGYDAIVFDFESEEGVRRLKEIKLWEVSIVTWAMNEQAKIEDVKSFAEGLKSEAKTGKISRSRLDALKPFIAVVRELADILSPFLEPLPPEPAAEDPATQNNITKSKQQKHTGVIFEIIPTPFRR